jgi:hypothetical protein
MAGEAGGEDFIGDGLIRRSHHLQPTISDQGLVRLRLGRYRDTDRQQGHGQHYDHTILDRHDRTSLMETRIRSGGITPPGTAEFE